MNWQTCRCSLSAHLLAFSSCGIISPFGNVIACESTKKKIEEKMFFFSHRWHSKRKKSDKKTHLIFFSWKIREKKSNKFVPVKLINQPHCTSFAVCDHWWHWEWTCKKNRKEKFTERMRNDLRKIEIFLPTSKVMLYNYYYSVGEGKKNCIQFHLIDVYLLSFVIFFYCARNESFDLFLDEMQ